MDTVLGIIVGVSLAAACGFRVFVPMLIMSLGVKAELLHLAEGWDWIGSGPAVTAFAVATFLEIVGYYVPWCDNALDALASPAAVVAGAVAAAACITDMSPFAQWSIAVIAGGGSAGIVQGTTVGSRAASTATTGGVANFIVSTIELGFSFVLAILAVVAPVLAAIMLGFIAVFIVRFIAKRRRLGLSIKAGGQAVSASVPPPLSWPPS